LRIWQLVVLAVVQGLTEFLPISSTAHLAVIPRLAHWQDPGLAFDVALHVGTLFAVLVYFAPTWKSIVLAFFPNDAGNGNGSDPEFLRSRKLGWLLILATIPAAISGFLFHKAAETSLRSLPIMGATMTLVGLFLWVADSTGSRAKRLPSTTLADALVIGVAQAFAVIPGVSRSGSTISAGLFRGMQRDAATRFSFLLSTPVIAGAALFEGHELWKMGVPPDMRWPIVFAILLSGVTGYLCIWGMIRYVRLNSLMVFVVYRIVAGLVILLIWYMGLA
jgi:undecaprenyl-diphosphatase